MSYAGAPDRPIALITGALGGIGRACCERLATDYRLALLDLGGERLNAAAADMASKGMEVVLATACDVADAAQVDACFEALGRTASIGALVHTAGVSPALADWETIIRANIAGTAHVLDACMPRTAVNGAAICIASMAGHGVVPDADLDAALDDPTATDLPARVEPSLARRLIAGDPYGLASPAYSVSKYAVQRMVAARAATWAQRGARIVSISPGLIHTPMGRKEVAENKRAAAVLEAIPGNRWGSPLDIANAAAFLASNQASYITGCDLKVDGGVTAQRATAVRQSHPA